MRSELLLPTLCIVGCGGLVGEGSPADSGAVADGSIEADAFAFQPEGGTAEAAADAGDEAADGGEEGVTCEVFGGSSIQRQNATETEGCTDGHHYTADCLCSTKVCDCVVDHDPVVKIAYDCNPYTAFTQCGFPGGT